MFSIFLMVFMILTHAIGFKQNRTLPQLHNMDSYDLYENLSKLPGISTPATSLLQEVFEGVSPKPQEQSLPLLHATQLIMDFIIKFLVDHDNIWETDEDTYLIRLGESHLYAVKCTLQQAILLNAKQIPFMAIATNNLADQNKEILRVNQILAKFPDVSLCIFQMQLSVLGFKFNFGSAYTTTDLKVFTQS